MIDVLLAEDVRRQDAAAEARGIPVERLMESAGWAVARAARRMLRGTYGRRVVVLCGKGNNAGDGFVAGRLLHEQGAHVTAVLTSDAPSPLAARNRERFPGRVVGMDGLAHEVARADLVIDALLGVGVTRPPDGAIAEAIAATRGIRARILAVDVPSGVSSDTGQVSGVAISANDTVTFGGFKPGLLFEPGRAHAGDVHIADIGLGIRAGEGAASVLEPADVASVVPQRTWASHKRSVGTVLVLAGSRGMPGAAALTVAASVRAGSGLTILCAPHEVSRIVLGRVPEITTIPVPDTEGVLGPKVLEIVRPALDRIDAIAIGPGMGMHPLSVELVRDVVRETTGPLVVDADALNALAHHSPRIERTGPTIVTPHAGELSRLTGMPVADLEADRLRAATDAARALGAVVLFKGRGTVVTDGTASFIDEAGGPALAQGGTGDALTGLLASFLAQRVASGGDADPRSLTFLAAAAAWIHGTAAARIAARAWPQPASASALIEELGPTMHDVLNP